MFHELLVIDLESFEESFGKVCCVVVCRRLRVEILGISRKEVNLRVIVKFLQIKFIDSL